MFTAQEIAEVSYKMNNSQSHKQCGLVLNKVAKFAVNKMAIPDLLTTC
jgi:hypothetical protein